MSRWRQWLTVTLPEQCSVWLLRSYRRPLSLFVGLILVPFCLIVGTTYQISISLWRQQTMHNLRTMARLGAEILTETLDETLSLEQLLAAQPEFAHAVAGGDGGAIRAILEQNARFLPNIHMVRVVNTDGRILAAVPEEGQTGTLSEDLESVQYALQGNGQPAVSAVYLHKGPDIEKVVSIGWPLNDGERFTGVLQVEQRIEDIKSWLQKVRVQPRGFLYVVDQRDQLIVFPYQKVPGKPLIVSDWPPVRHPLDEHGSTLMFRSDKTHDLWLSGMYPVGGIGWRVVTVQPERAALKTLRNVLAVLGLLIALATALIAAIGSRWLKVHAFSMHILEQNARLLKQQQQRRFFGQGEGPPLEDQGTE